jgi:hypothetical protein
MKGLPPLANKRKKYELIIERECYGRIYDAIYDRAKKFLERGWDTTIHVSGNPGIGKSRFYLYCIFRLLLEKSLISNYLLVINFKSNYYVYNHLSEDFIQQNQAEVEALMEESRLLRFIEGESDLLAGWSGVSVLFASPGVPGLNNFMKNESVEFFLPVWTLNELKDLNLMLEDALPENTLLELFNMFGGIPRFIFTDALAYEKSQLELAINSFGALKIISYVKGKTVREQDYSHRVLCMVPSDDYRSILHLDFLSKYAAEKVVDKVTDDSIYEL